jgi:TolB-like protein/Tfp pilus assembly protein PilF
MIGYGVVAFAVLQVTEPIMHGAELPDWTLKAVLLALVLGFPVAVILAWVYDLTAQGVKRTSSSSGPGVPTFGRARFLLPLAVSAAVLAIAAAGAGGWYAWKRTTQNRPGPAAGDSPSIAVLPFKDLSPDHDQEYFSDGMAEEILTALSKVKGLRVPGRASSFYFKGKNVEPGEIARKLGVAHLLEGSVRRSGNKLRISAEVVRASDGDRIWSQAFNRDLTDVFAVQDEISRDVVEALRVKLMPGQAPPPKEYRTTNQEAYQSYLLGTHFAQSFSGDSQMRAIAALERAVEIDPGFAPAWAMISHAKLAVGTFAVIPWADARRHALVAANRAVEVAPDLPEAIAARAVARLAEWDWAGAQADVDRLRERWPDDPASIRAMARHAGWMGRNLEAVDLVRRYLDKDPLNGAAWNSLGVNLWWAGRYEEAGRAFARALEVDPRNDFAAGNWGKALVEAGRPAEGLAMCEKASPGDKGHLECKALAHQALGNLARAQEALDGMLANPQGDLIYLISRIYACRGEKNLAFDWLERARVAHVRSLNGLMSDPCFRPLRPDPRWAANLRAMSFPWDDQQEAASPAAAPASPSIAVLPFADMSPKHDQEYFADGVAEEILNALAQVKGLKVIGRASSFSFRGKPDDLRTIGQKLGVANVLEGSIRKEGSQIRVAVKLVRVDDGSQVWSEIYDRKLAGIFKVQDEIARAVVGKLAPLLEGTAASQAGRVPSTTPEAYAQFLLGRQLQERLSEEEVQRSLDAFERAVALDPGYAPAWAGLANSYYIRSQRLGPDAGKMREKGRAAAERAVALGPDLSVGYEARSSFRLADWDWDGARADAERAVVLDPGSAVARRRRALVQRIVSGDPARGLQDLELAMTLDPLAKSGWHQMGLRRRLLREPQKARDALRRALEIDPGYGPAIGELAILELQAGRVAEARHLVAKIPQTQGATKVWPAILAHAEGNEELARDALAEVTQAFGATNPALLASLHAMRGEVDQAFQWLDLALSRRDPWLRYARDSFWLEPLHSDPRWKEVLKKMNLPVD